MPKMFDPKEEAKKLDPFLKVLPFLLLLLILVVSIVGEVQAHYVETAKAMFAVTIVCCIIFFIVIFAFIAYRFRKNRKELKEATSDAKNVHSASLPPNIHSTSSLSRPDHKEKPKKTKKVTLVEQSTILLTKKKDVELGVSENI